MYWFHNNVCFFTYYRFSILNLSVSFYRKLDAIDTMGRSQGNQKKNSQVILNITENQNFYTTSVLKK